MLRPVLFVCLTISAPAWALPLHFQRIADTATAIPGGSGAFSNLEFVSLDAGRVSFLGYGTSSQRGIYSSSGGPLERVVDASTPVPGGGGQTFGVARSVVDGDQVVFRSYGSEGTAGIYRSTPGTGTYEVIADTTMPRPNAPGNFTLFDEFSADGGQVAFAGYGSGVNHEAIYRTGPGGLEVVAFDGQPMPSHTENFEGFAGLNLDGGVVTFTGYDANTHGGIYTDRNGALEVVVQEGDTSPSGRPFWTFPQSPDIAGGDVAFRANTNPQVGSGIFLDQGSGIQTIADRLTNIPEGTGRFDQFVGYPSVDEGRVLFRGRGSDAQDGIYLALGGALHKVVAEGDVIDGLVVDYVNMTTSGLDGDQLALVVTFHRPPGSDFSVPTPEVVYLVTIPEPGTAALLGVGLAALAARRRRT